MRLKVSAAVCLVAVCAAVGAAVGAVVGAEVKSGTAVVVTRSRSMFVARSDTPPANAAMLRQIAAVLKRADIMVIVNGVMKVVV